MRKPILRALAVGLAGALFVSGPLASEVRAASTAVAGLGLATVFGAGAAARVDPAAALFENPAALALLPGAAVWSSAAFSNGIDVTRFGIAVPFVDGPTLALGHSGFAGTQTGRRDVAYLGAARLLPGALAVGVTLELQSDSESGSVDESFGIDLGMHWRALVGGPVPGRFETGLVLDRADADSRALRAAAAWTSPLGSAWSAGMSTGLEGNADSRRVLAYAGFLRRGIMEVAAGVHDGAFRLGGAAGAGAWRLAYTYSDDDNDASHGLGVQWRFGPSRDERRQARERALELEMAGRVNSLAGAVETSRLAAWQRAGARALENGRFDAAADWYRALLALRPEDGRAQEGLQRARHAAVLYRADSLLQQHDPVGAAGALEQAIRIMPADTTSALRLQELRNAARHADRARDTTSQLFDEAVQAYAQQRHQDAVRGFDEVLRLDPKHSTAASYRKLAQSAHELSVRSAMRSARQRFDAGDLDAARGHVRRVLEDEPRHQEAQKLLTRIEQRTQRALSPAPPAVEDASPTVPAFVVQRYQEGMQRYRGGDLVGAMRAWEEVSRSAPHYDEVDQYLLRVYRVTGLESYTEGHLREAVDIFEKGLRLEPDNVQLRRYLNQAYEKLKRTQPTDVPVR